MCIGTAVELLTGRWSFIPVPSIHSLFPLAEKEHLFIDFYICLWVPTKVDRLFSLES